MAGVSYFDDGIERLDTIACSLKTDSATRQGKSASHVGAVKISGARLRSPQNLSENLGCPCLATPFLGLSDRFFGQNWHK